MTEAEKNTDKEEQLAAVAAACADCTRCALSGARTRSVFGCGNSDAHCVFVGEAPGESEDRLGIPFVGAAGKLFDSYLEAVGIDRASVYICNILKCRPPQNRDPEDGETQACIGYLREQIRIVRPSLIVCLGRIAAAQIIHSDFRITREHGVFVQRGSYTLTAVYHPSALLRDPSRRADMFTDMKKVAAFLSAPGEETNG